MYFQSKITVWVLVLLMSAALLCAAPLNNPVKVFHAKDSPVELIGITAQKNFQYQLLIVNKTNMEIEGITLHGLTYSGFGAVNGGFLIGFVVELKAGQQTQITMDLSSIVNDTIQDILLIPTKTYFRLRDEKAEPITQFSYWMLDKKQIEKITPYNLDSYKEVQGKLFSLKEAEAIPTQVFCEWCRDEAAGACGSPIIAGNCKPTAACCLSYNCNQQTQQCYYYCKPPDECC
jgi:hypothetical protein